MSNLRNQQRSLRDRVRRSDRNDTLNRTRTYRRLVAETLERRMLLTTITSVSPPANSFGAAASADIVATFDQGIVAGTATPDNFVVRGSVSHGRLAGGVSASGADITFNPTDDFAAGEVVQVTATAGISTTGGAGVPRVWEFRTASSGSGQFVDAGHGLGSTNYQVVSLGDVDGDSDLDAVLGGQQLWLNDGAGGFVYGQNLGSALGAFGLEFGDVDDDGDLDLVAGARVMLNDGSGSFVGTGQALGGNGSAIPGDLDGDGDLDVMTAVPYAANRVFFNNGSGSFTDSGQTLTAGPTDALVLGDFDDDGDLDAFEVNAGVPNKVWMNDGSGGFTDSGQMLGGFRAGKDADVGDVDGDGDLDVVVANVYSNTGARVYLNNGSGIFTETGQSIGGGTGNLYRVRLGDFDGDGDLDVFAPQRSAPGSEVWMNDGSGGFADSGQRLFFTGTRRIDGADVGDLDGDGDLDFIEAIWAPDGGARVWLNQNLTPNVSLSVDSPTIAEEGGAAIITATLSAAHTDPVTVELEVSGNATATDDYTVSATQIVIAAGATTGSVTVTAVQDAADEPDEAVVVDITSVTNGQEVGTQQVTITILDDDEAPVPDVTLTVDNATIPEAAGVATFTVTLSEVATVPVTVELGITGSAAATDFTSSGSQIVIAAGATTGTVTVTAVQDEENEPDETVIVDITSVTGGNEAGTQQQTVTIVDDDVAPGFAIRALDPTDSGFRVEFTKELDGSDVNLYDTQNAGLGPADVVVTGASSGAVVGSLVIDTSAVTFVKSGGPLAADTYTVTLRSATDGFKDTAAMLLDGNGDGTAGDDYVSNFTIDEAPADARTISIPDFVRGPGQDVNLPADETTGIPITISDGDNVRAADVRVSYDPALLQITGATAPAGGSVIVNTTTTPGVAILVFFSSASLPAGSTTFINLQATVPTVAASANYGLQQVLDLHSVTIGDGNDNEFAVVVDDAHHFATYFADVSGNGRINASDAAQVARFAALIDAGFAGSLNADPITVGDISGNGRINAADASRVAQFAALIDVPEIPPVPGGIQITGLVNPSPLNVGTTPIIVGPFAGQSESGNPAESAASDFLVVENFVSKGSETPNIDQVAVDQMMAGLANSVNDEQAELGSASVLERSLEELLSAVD